MLADLGAEVIKIEKPGRGDTTRGTPPFAGDWSHYFAAVNWGKRGLGIDLKKPEGVDLFLRLVEHSDVVIDNFRAGTVDELGLGYDVLAARNPRIIRCGISGFGATGPLAQKPAFDVIIQAMAGFMAVTGERGGPPLRTGVSIGDVSAGAFALGGIALALYTREKTGRGQNIDVGMFDSLVSFMTYYLTLFQITGKEPPKLGSQHASMVPLGSFRTQDGHVIIASFNDSFWRRACEALGHPELTEDPRFKTVRDRQTNRDACNEAIEAITIQKPTAYWVEALEAADVPVGPILSVGQLLDDPHLAARELLRTIDLPDRKLRVAGQPLRMSEHAQSVAPAPPPVLGADTQAVLRDVLGVDSEGYLKLKEAGVVA